MSQFDYICMECGSKNTKVKEYKKFLKKWLFIINPLIFMSLFLFFNYLLDFNTYFATILFFITSEISILLLIRKSKRYKITCSDCLNNFSIDNLDEIEK